MPGEIDTDAVNTQHGLAFKILGVKSEKLSGHNADTQDFVLDSGNRFSAPDAKTFLRNHRILEHAPQMPDEFKTAVLDASRAAKQQSVMEII